MNIKCESEELDLEYDSYQQDSQIFCDNESDFTLKIEDIKTEELDLKVSIKSELTESEKEFVLGEGLVNSGVIKSENVMMMEEKTCGQHSMEFVTLKNVQSLLNKVNDGGSEAQFESDEERFFAQILMSKSPSVLLKKLTDIELKTLLGYVGVAEKGSKRKSTSKSRPQSSVTRDQSLEESHLQNFSCRFCNFSFKSKDMLKSHLKTHEKRKFKCVHCSYEGNSKALLKKHLLIHSNVKLFKCSECSYESNFKGDLKRHMSVHGNVKLFKCSHCSYEYNHRGSLKRHMLIHGNVKLFKCSECSYGCNDKTNLKRHMSIHGNVNLFKCSKCSYECNYKSSLKNHLLSHENVKLYKCSECNYGCNHKPMLIRHMLIHTNVKLFKCCKCSYECNYKRNLKVHMLVHHKE
ncbi:UNVERIFIED_CONTAM: hypothetical protein RMT77_014803 [Armadillidium vulgare]